MIKSKSHHDGLHQVYVLKHIKTGAYYIGASPDPLKSTLRKIKRAPVWQWVSKYATKRPYHDAARIKQYLRTLKGLPPKLTDDIVQKALEKPMTPYQTLMWSRWDWKIRQIYIDIQQQARENKRRGITIDPP